MDVEFQLNLAYFCIFSGGCRQQSDCFSRILKSLPLPEPGL